MSDPMIEIYDSRGNRVMYSDYIGAVPNPKLANEMLSSGHKIFIRGKQVYKKNYTTIYSDLNKASKRKKSSK